MIKKTFSLFIALFSVYTLIIFLNPSMSAFQHQWQENTIRVEKYIYDNTDTIKNVIVGSSLSQRIKSNDLNNFYNLALAGQSIFDGLEVIRQKKKLPENVFIETNLVFKEQTKGFSSGFFSPFIYNIKKNILSLRSDKQPLVFIYPTIQKIIHKGNPVTLASGNSIKDAAIFSNLLKLQVASFSEIPDTGFVSKQFLLLTNLVNDLKTKGVNIIFFEMPINPNLIELPKARLIRNKFYEYFPVNKNNYIKTPDCSTYITGDGIHLKEDEAIKYTKYFKEEVGKYTLISN